MVGAGGFARNTCTAKHYVRIFGRFQDNLAKFLIDDLLLRFCEDAAGFDHRFSLGSKFQGCRYDRIGRKLRFATEIPDGDEMIVTLKPEQPAGIGMSNELALRIIEAIALRGSATPARQIQIRG